MSAIPNHIVHSDSGYKPWVQVDCSCDDLVGGNLCYAVKDQLRSSAGFRLSDQLKSFGIAVHLVCIDEPDQADSRGNSSAVSETITTYTDTSFVLEFYETSSVMIVGTQRIHEMAMSIVSNVDKVASENSSFFALEVRKAH